ncbi:MAG: hypothetical protein HYX72_01305 [Acidobacteria bacterium]|nr:hypothetical protein [Acidobacteriota bacterium]
MPVGVPTSTTLNVDRAQNLTTADAASSGDGVYALSFVKFQFEYPAGYLNSLAVESGSPDYKQALAMLRPGRMRILYASITLNTKAGVSPAFEKSFADSLGTYEANVYGTLCGPRASAGGLLTITVPGPLEVGDDVAASIQLPAGTTVGVTYAKLGTAPTGAAVQFRIDSIYPNGTVVEGGVVSIEDGSTEVDAIASGAAGGDVGNIQPDFVSCNDGFDLPRGLQRGVLS